MLTPLPIRRQRSRIRYPVDGDKRPRIDVKTPEYLKHAIWQMESMGISRYWYEAYRAQYNSAMRRGIAFRFTLFAWVSWWKRELGRIGPEARRGIRTGEYMMCRLNDAGDYQDGNVYAGTAKDNQADIKQRDPQSRSMALKRWHATHDCHLKGKVGFDHPKSHGVVTPLGVFGSMALAAKAHGITRQAVRCRVRDASPGWSRMIRTSVATSV